MKKVLVSLLTLALLCALTACGGQAQSGGNDGEASQQPSAAQSQQPSATPAPDNQPEETPTGLEVPPAEDETQVGNGVLVAYFSATGTTRPVAERMAEALGAELYEIVPEQPYTDADLNYNTDCRANDEQNDPSARPGISGSVENMEQYDTILLGYPIWWGVEPKIVDTFLESYDLSGKTIVPFCTSGGSGVGSSVSSIRKLVPGAEVLDGRRFSGGASQDDVADWLAGLGLAG